jgi:hypothetical protein
MNWHEPHEPFKSNYFAYDFSFCFVHNYNYNFVIRTLRTTTTLHGCCKKIDEKGTEASTLTLSRRNIDDNVKDKLPTGDSNNSSNHSKGLLPSCPEGSELIRGKCICPDGSSLKNNKCSIQLYPKPIKCPDGTSMVDDKCQCPDDSEMPNGKCICPDADSSSLINDKYPKPSPPGSLTFLSVVKKVINNGIGNKKPSDFTITVTGNVPFILNDTF